MFGMEDRAGQRPAVTGPSTQSVPDEFGAHVIGDLPTSELPGAEIDTGLEVEVRPNRDGQVSDVIDIVAVRLTDGEVPPEQVGKRMSGDWSGIVVFTRRRSRIPAS
ncbi:hypothetical protein GCM10010401_16930 [Rarobacter faecitabidus]